MQFLQPVKLSERLLIPSQAEIYFAQRDAQLGVVGVEIGCSEKSLQSIFIFLLLQVNFSKVSSRLKLHGIKLQCLYVGRDRLGVFILLTQDVSEENVRLRRVWTESHRLGCGV